MTKYHHGVYSVDGITFHDKLEAIIYASEKKLGPGDIKWDYYSDIFNSLNLKEEPQFSLDVLYKQRAMQIREQYDYVVLLSSGGADSTQMCESFLANGIHVDEVIGSAPVEGLSNWKTNSADTSAENTISETFLAQIPYLKELQTKYSVKISINDYFRPMLSYKQDDWLLKSSDFLHPTTLARFSLETLPHLKKIAESGKRMAVVYGIDKPIVGRGPPLSGGPEQFVLIFSDIVLNTIRQPFNEYFSNVDTVAFYWSPELPLIPLKQAHTVAKYAVRPENKWLYDRISGPIARDSNMSDRSRMNSEYQRGISHVIYPSTWENRFQAHKPTTAIHANHDYWFYSLHSNLNSSVSMIKSDIDNFFRSINPEFIIQKGGRLWPYINRYPIGHVADFTN